VIVCWQSWVRRRREKEGQTRARGPMLDGFLDVSTLGAGHPRDSKRKGQEGGGGGVGARLEDPSGMDWTLAWRL
jgi:hypothetical protein